MSDLIEICIVCKRRRYIDGNNNRPCVTRDISTWKNIAPDDIDLRVHIDIPPFDINQLEMKIMFLETPHNV